MSYQAVQWALDEAPMLRTPKGLPDTTARFVLVARAERADEQGRNSHAAVTDIMWRTGYDERTVQRAEDRLAEAGLMWRDGTTRWGTTRWHLNLDLKRDPAERDEVEAAIERRKEADRERARARRQAASRTAPDGPRLDPASRHLDPASRHLDPASRHLDRASGCLDAAPPEPPTNLPGTPRETSQESPTGGTLPPDPLRPGGPTGHRNGQNISIYSGPDQPPCSDTVSYDRARETDTPRPPLRVIEGNATTQDPGPRGIFPAAVPEQPSHRHTDRAVGWCLQCADTGQYTPAADPVNGDACVTHLRLNATRSTG